MTTEIVNFGHNIRWTPSHSYRPTTEAELLEIMGRHRGEKLRVVASKHSWSPIAATEGVTIDMGGFSSVEIYEDDEVVHVTVGGGCVIQDLLNQLHSSSEWTLPTLGAIKRQTIAGAISTGTHGSGSQGLSHFVASARVARFHPETGDPEVVTVSDGDELLAVRCGLGCTGILVDVQIPCRPRYLVEESLHRYTTLSDLLSDAQDHSLSFFIMLPYANDFILWRRTPTEWRPLSWLQRAKAGLYRLHKFFGSDILLHCLVTGLKSLSFTAHQRFFKILPKLLVLDRPVVDESEAQLTLEHHLFRHVEMEVFVPAQHLEQAVTVVKESLLAVAGDLGATPSEFREDLSKQDLLDGLLALRGSYLHHYPIVVRRILPEDTLISMASGDQTWYSLSLFSYSRNLDSYNGYCEWLANALNVRFGARIHWGKHCPLDHHSLAPLYPDLETFKNVCQAHDPKGVFRNEYVDRVLGFETA